MGTRKKRISLTLDDNKIEVPAGTTIMEAAEQLGIYIPRLCYHPDLSLAELLLDNHPKDCQTCERDGNCELQNLAYSMGVRERFFEGQRKRHAIEDSSVSVVRNAEKCILCGRCVRACAEIQGVYNLSQHGRGFNTVVGPAHLCAMDDSVCIQCGQCINVCPTAAFLEKSSTEDVWRAIADPGLHVVAQCAPSIRAAIGEGFGMAPGTPASGKMVTALRRLGFDAVFDTDLGADLTIVEEAHEFLTRLREGPLPMITSCSPGWINFLERFYPSLIPHASTCRSPMSMLSVLAKTYYAEQKGLDPDNICMVAVMPCVAKKFEAGRPEHRAPDGRPYTDAVLTTRELIWMIKCYGIHLATLPDGQFDPPLGIASGAGDIFGTTGGVMEATLRAASELVTGRPADRLEFTEVRAVEGLRETYVAIGDQNIHVGVANGLTNAKVLLDKVIEGKESFHVLEIMACPGGCIGGGGQPYPPPGVKVLDPELLRRRAAALYSIDQSKTLRKSYENPAVEELYDNFLDAPGSPKAHELLHTHYHAREPRGIR